MCLVYPAHENADYNIGFKPESKGEKKRAAGAKTPRPGVARGYSKGIFSKVSVCVCVCACVCVCVCQTWKYWWNPGNLVPRKYLNWQKMFGILTTLWQICILYPFIELTVSICVEFTTGLNTFCNFYSN